MTYTSLALGFLIGAVLVGSWSSAARRPWLAATIAAGVVVAQFALFLLS